MSSDTYLVSGIPRVVLRSWAHTCKVPTLQNGGAVTLKRSSYFEARENQLSGNRECVPCRVEHAIASGDASTTRREPACFFIQSASEAARRDILASAASLSPTSGRAGVATTNGRGRNPLADGGL